MTKFSVARANCKVLKRTKFGACKLNKYRFLLCRSAAYCKIWSGEDWSGFVKHGFVKGGFVKQGFVKGGFVKHGFVKDGFVKDGFVKGGFVKHDNLRLKRATRKVRIFFSRRSNRKPCRGQ